VGLIDRLGKNEVFDGIEDIVDEQRKQDVGGDDHPTYNGEFRVLLGAPRCDLAES
jgi:hypothetical protein